MQGKYFTPEYLFEGTVVSGINACENEMVGSISFQADGVTETARMEVNYCRRVSQNFVSAIMPKIKIPVGAKVEFRCKPHTQDQILAYDVKVL